MAAVLPESKREVLEDKDDALLPEPKLEDGEEFSSLDEVGKTEEEPELKPEPKGAKKAAPEKEDDDELPAEYRGKSLKDVIKMHRDAASLIGRQGSELGEFRRKADLLIQASLENLRKGQKTEEKEPEKKEEELDDTQFFAGPKDAVSRMIENHPLIKEIRKTLGATAADREQDRAARATERFNQAHPDSAKILQDPEFREWVKASKVRTALMQRADSKFDFDAADEVFGTWKALKGLGKKEEAKPEESKGELDASAAARALAKRKQELRDAKTPSGGGGGQKESGSKKIYRRADVLKLMEEDPDRYEALAPEIEKAYRDGRVR